MKYSICSFEQLSSQRLYAILRLRQQVFVLEQNSFYEDIDNFDQSAWHLCVEQMHTADLLAYARLRINPEQKAIMKIERVVVEPSSRKLGLGAGMMESMMAFCRQQPDINLVQLSAQTTVVAFYQKWGFCAYGEVYDDGGIAHRNMQLQL